MSRIVLVAGAAVAALSIAACSPKTDTPPATADTAATDAAATAAEAPPAAPVAPTAAEFVEKAAASDMFEIEAGKLAQSKAKNAEVKKFAGEMVTAHTKSTADLKKAIADSGQTITPPAALPADLQTKLDMLKTAPDFDKAYVDGQVAAHEEALALLQSYSSGGDVPAIKTFATATLPVVQTHLDHARTLAAPKP